MGTIEQAFAVPPPVAELAPSNPDSGPPAICTGVIQTGECMSAEDYAREQAIFAARRDLQTHMEMRAAALALYRDTSCLTYQADADRCLILAREARMRMESLIEGRSKERIAAMVAAQAERMKLEPGA